MTARSSLTVVLAAGEGTRMRSSLPKVLHPVAGQSLLSHVLQPPRTAPAIRSRWWSGRTMRRSRTKQAGAAGSVDFRPARAARYRARGAGGARGDRPRRRRSPDCVRRHAADLGGDLRAPARAAEGRAALAVLGFRAADPTGYGRLVVEGDRLVAIREQADASGASGRSRCAMPA